MQFFYITLIYCWFNSHNLHTSFVLLTQQLSYFDPSIIFQLLTLPESLPTLIPFSLYTYTSHTHYSHTSLFLLYSTLLLFSKLTHNCVLPLDYTHFTLLLYSHIFKTRSYPKLIFNLLSLSHLSIYVLSRNLDAILYQTVS